MLELSSLGLSPSVLHSLLQPNDGGGPHDIKGKQRAAGERPIDSSDGEDTDDPTTSPPEAEVRKGVESLQPKAVYELVQDGERLEPRLRLWVGETRDYLDEEPTSTDVSEDGSNSRVAIYLDKPDSTPSSPVAESSEEGLRRSTSHEELLLVSKPVTSKPGQSLVWSLQKRTKGEETEMEDAWNSLSTVNDSEDTSPSASAHPVELVKKQ